MITNALLSFINTVVGAIFSPLPTGTAFGLNTLATTITGSSYWPSLGWINNYIPVDSMVTAAGVLLAAVAITLLVRVGIWLWNTLKP